jgi:hypothetical protein
LLVHKDLKVQQEHKELKVLQARKVQLERKVQLQPYLVLKVLKE